MARRFPRVRGTDLGYVSLAAAVGVFFVVASHTDPNAGDLPPLLLDVSVGLVWTVVFLLFRRRLPGTMAAASSVVAIVSATGLGLASVAGLNVAVHRPRRVTAALAAWHILLITAVWRLDDTTSERAYWESLLVVTLLHVVMVSFGMLVRSQRLLVVAAQERARQAEEGQRLRVEEARHHERERLAREMHDVLAHRISLLAVHAGALEYRGNLPPEEARAAGVIRECAHDALEDLREVIGILRESPDDDAERPQPTLGDLAALVAESRRAGEHVTLEHLVPDGPAIPSRVGRHAYRIVQEGLTNARKHAPGAHVRIIVDGRPGDGLTIEIANPLPVGRSTAPAVLPGAGAGLIGLSERVGLVGGRLEHGGTSGGDFRLRAWLPFPG
ncbi:sensor histidine kinase [Thermomonospora umbrina]|uniref:sensor histidine kinase n=1 Tax=Thermomonospora umbrina TaxID=111806 RepID=UPI001FE545B9|nr:histidine kinase [Thermomonospora umbrina]